MKNEKGKKLVYSNREYITNTKRLKYQRILQNYKKDNIKEQEKELSKYNSKSCTYEKFKEYVKNYLKIMRIQYIENINGMDILTERKN